MDNVKSQEKTEREELVDLLNDACFIALSKCKGSDDKKVCDFLADYLLEHGVAIRSVVRCKDCKYAYINSFSKASGVILCKHWTDRTDGYITVMQNDDYCCYGEKKESENEQKYTFISWSKNRYPRMD